MELMLKITFSILKGCGWLAGYSFKPFSAGWTQGYYYYELKEINAGFAKALENTNEEN